jgi:hypothetical protein
LAPEAKKRASLLDGLAFSEITKDFFGIFLFFPAFSPLTGRSSFASVLKVLTQP